jgi:large subunit ribosomal protein L2
MLLSKYKKKSHKLFFSKKKSAGRNNTGRITVAHQGGGHKQLYRNIFFKKPFYSGLVINIEYDPNRSSHIAKICYKDNVSLKKKYYYILASKKLNVLDNIDITLESNNKQEGNFYFIDEFNIGDFVYNIELSPNKGGQIVRSAGTFAQVLQKSLNFVTVILPSGEHRLIPNNCTACFGGLSNENHKNTIIKKAGRSR